MLFPGSFLGIIRGKELGKILRGCWGAEEIVNMRKSPGIWWEVDAVGSLSLGLCECICV